MTRKVFYLCNISIIDIFRFIKVGTISLYGIRSNFAEAQAVTAYTFQSKTEATDSGK